MWTFLARFILRNRILLLSVLALLTAFMLYHADNINMGYGFARMMPDDDPVSIEFAEFEKTFGQVSNTMVIVMEDEEFFTPLHIAQWKELADSLAQIDGVDDVLTVTSAYDLEVNEDEEKLNMVPVMTSLPQTMDEARAFKQKLKNLPFYKNLLYTDDGDVIMMMMRINQGKLYNKEIIRIIDEVRAINTNFEKRTGLTVHTSGLPYIRMANTTRLRNEVYLLVAGTLFVTAILLFVFLRSVRATAISLLVVSLGVVFTFGLLGFFGFELSMLSSLIPPLVIVIGVPNCIYLINKYHQEYKKHNNQIKALHRVIRRIGTVTVMTNFTTALGFATFILTDSQALVEFGIISSLIILFIFMLSIIMIPVIYSYVSPPKERHYQHFDKKYITGLLRFLTNAVSHHRPAIYITTIAFVIIGIVGIFQLEVKGNLKGDLSHSDRVYQDIEFIEAKFHGVVPLEIVIDCGEKKCVEKLSALKKIDEFQTRVSELPLVSRSLSLVDFVKFTRQGILFGNPEMYGLPTRQEQQWMMKYLPRGDQKTDMMSSLVDSTRQKARISMQMADMGTTEMRELQQKITAIAGEVFDDDTFKVTITGSSVKFIRTTDYLIKNLILSMALAILVISVLMAFLFGSGRMVFISVLPNMIPLILTAGIMGYFGIPIKPSTILIFSIAFGISIDDTIHFLARYRQELKSNGWRIGEAVKTSIKETGASMFYTSVVLFFGFSVFLLSSFGGTMAVGLLVAVTLIFAMLTNLLLLPAFLMSLDKFIRARDFTESIIEIYDEQDAEDDEEDIDLSDAEDKNGDVSSKTPN
jgi:predicted RND superfamily exporter protein